MTETCGTCGQDWADGELSERQKDGEWPCPVCPPDLKEELRDGRGAA